ncbi:MGMT family protein [Pontiellaceae bacterium B1224]|nr:MGMT family protein [Pontiellaceae bacterium B1224]
MPRTSFTEEVIEIIRDIPRGKVMTYGGVAARAGSPRAARQVVRVLHTCSETEELPWWRVINREGCISLKPGFGYEEQEDLLRAEGILVDEAGRVNLDKTRWNVGIDE